MPPRPCAGRSGSSSLRSEIAVASKSVEATCRARVRRSRSPGSVAATDIGDVAHRSIRLLPLASVAKPSASIRFFRWMALVRRRWSRCSRGALISASFASLPRAGFPRRRRGAWRGGRRISSLICLMFSASSSASVCSELAEAIRASSRPSGFGE